MAYLETAGGTGRGGSLFQVLVVEMLEVEVDQTPPPVAIDHVALRAFDRNQLGAEVIAEHCSLLQGTHLAAVARTLRRSYAAGAVVARVSSFAGSNGDPNSHRWR